MAQTAMRAPHPKMAKVVVEGIDYDVKENGVVIAHDAHIPALKSLGFVRCQDETSDVVSVGTISDAELKLLAQLRSGEIKVAAPSTEVKPESAPAPKTGK